MDAVGLARGGGPAGLAVGDGVHPRSRNPAMPVPAFRTSPTRKRKRRSHLALKRTGSVQCPNCGDAKMPHRACPSCGYVRPGLQVKSAGEE
ncbi:MAG: 50S ribosomal protein L32 [Planctomycetota bacterium]